MAMMGRVQDSRRPTGRRLGRFGCLVAGVMSLAFLHACVAPPPPRAAGPLPPLPSTQVYFYPKKAQSETQQDRDRYECYLWAVKQSGFDPSSLRLAPHQRIEVVPMPPAGYDTAVGAVTGAILGAAIGAPGETAEGAAIGAVAGAVIGAASDAARKQQAERVEEAYDRREARGAARIEQQAADYRRAMGACLAGRGYTVR